MGDLERGLASGRRVAGELAPPAGAGRHRSFRRGHAADTPIGECAARASAPHRQDGALDTPAKGFDNKAAVVLVIALAVMITVRPRELNFLRLLPFLLPLLLLSIHLAGRTPDGLKSVRISFPVLLLAAYASTTTAWSEALVLSVAESISIFTLAAIASIVASFCSLRELVAGVLAGCLSVFGASVVVALVSPGYGLVSDTYEAGSLRGIMLDRNSLSFVLLIGLIAALVYDFRSRSRRAAKFFICALFVSGVLWTASSTCLIMSVVAIAFAAELALIRRVPVSQRKWAAMGGALVTAVVAVYVAARFNEVLMLVDRDPSLTGRTRIWPAVQNMISQNPWLGHGWGAVWSNPSLRQQIARSVGFDVSHSHNGYLDIQIQLGAVGLALTLLVLLLVCFRGVALYIRSSSSLSSWPLLLTVVLVLYNRVETSFSAPSTMFLMFVTLVVLDRTRAIALIESERSLQKV